MALSCCELKIFKPCRCRCQRWRAVARRRLCLLRFVGVILDVQNEDQEKVEDHVHVGALKAELP